jgi:hypothetical protein
VPGRMIVRRRLAGAWIAAGLLLAPVAWAQESATAPARAPFRWTDPEGKPLPFDSEDELLDFLRTASVKRDRVIESGGTTLPRKLLLEKNGVRADAIFREVDEDATAANFSGAKSDLSFRDSYIFEPAAYQLSRLLGLDNVPPAALRVLERKGSIQIWVENAMTETKRVKDNIQPPDDQRWKQQVLIMNVFDELAYNTDRNRGNVLITPDWKLWMIDHTRAFRRSGELQHPDALTQCERGLYQRLRTMDEATARARLREYLTGAELDDLFRRRRIIVDRFERLIAEQGEDRVLYTYSESPPQPPPPAATH